MPKKIVLAYSGGLDTSIILKWLQLEYNCPIITFTADLGQNDEINQVEDKAKAMASEDLEKLKSEYMKNLK